MAVYLITLSLLIAAVLLIRTVFRKSLSPRFMYALWLAVVIKLCLPLSLFEVAIPSLPVMQSPPAVTDSSTPDDADTVQGNVSNPYTPPIQAVVPGTQTPAITSQIPPVTAPDPSDAPVTADPPAVTATPGTDIPATTESRTTAPTPKPFPIKAVIIGVWIAGSVALALWFLISGNLFRYRLYADRTLYRMLRKTKVYVTSVPGAPCLAGLIPSIYITPDVASNKSKTLIMIHEYTHLRHGDHIWSFLRMLALIVYWWNPLVWAAAFASKQDAELACDDTIAKKLDDEKRFEYAHILLDTVPHTHQYAVALASAPMKERILRLTKQRKNPWFCAALAIVLIVAAVGCSFLGVKDSAEDVNTVRSVFTEEIDALPQDAEDALLSACAIGGSPVYYIFDEGLTYCRYSIAEDIYGKYDIRLPEEYTGGRIYYVGAGAGSREMRFVIETERKSDTQSEAVYLDCYFRSDYETVPDGNLVLTEMKSLTEAEALQLAVTSETQSALWIFARSNLDFTQNWSHKLLNFYAGEGSSEGDWEALPTGAVLPASFDFADCTAYAYPLTAQTPVVLRYDAGDWWLYTGYTLLDIGTRADFSEVMWHLSEAFFLPKNDRILEPDATVDGYKFYFETQESGTTHISTLVYTGIKYYNPVTGDAVRIHTLQHGEAFKPISNGEGLVLIECDCYGFIVLDLRGGWYTSLSTNKLPYFVYWASLPELHEYGTYVTDSARFLDGGQLYAKTKSGDLILTLEDGICTITQGRLLYDDSVLAFIPAGTVHEVEALPADASTAIHTAQAIGGSPKVYQFTPELTYYVCIMNATGDVHTVYECTLPLPIGATDGKIIHITGGNSGELRFTIKAQLGGETVSYQYLISCSESLCTPTNIWYPYNVTEEFGSGPFVGYVRDAQTPDIELYTAKNGALVGKIPYEIFHDWIATDRTSPYWTAGFMDGLSFYYAEFYEYRWAAVHLNDTVMGNGRKIIATSADGGKTWTFGSTADDYGGNHVVGVGFASETVAFMSFHYANEYETEDGSFVTGPVISRTTDGGKTWHKLSLDIPASLQGYQMNGLCPIFDGQGGTYPIRLYKDGKEERTVYLITADGGMTWTWRLTEDTPSLTQYSVDLPLNADNREYITSAASYGPLPDISSGDKITPGADGIRYEVFGVGSHFKLGGNFSAYKTYRITSQNGYLTEVTEVETFTKDVVRQNGKPFTGDLTGIYRTIAYCKNNGLMSYTLYLEADGQITTTAYLHGTDAGGSSESTWHYDPASGTFTAEVIRRTASNGEISYSGPLKISGKLYEYGGFVHFLCESSDSYAITPADPLPLTFSPNTDGHADAPTVVLDDTVSGEWFHSYVENDCQNFYYLKLNPDTAQIRFYTGTYQSEYGNRYTGTYTINPLTRKITATLTDPSEREGHQRMILEFYYGFSITFEDSQAVTRLYLSPRPVMRKDMRILWGKASPLSVNRCIR